MKRHWAPWLLICLGLAWWATRLLQGPSLRLVVTLDESETAFLRQRGESFSAGEGIVHLKARGHSTWESIHTLYRYECRQAELNLANIVNVNTVVGPDGGPYRRQRASLHETGEIVSEKDNGDCKWVYDPTNPNAEKEGPHVGYVGLPNVNLTEEDAWRQAHQDRARLLARVLEKLDPGCLAVDCDAPVLPPSGMPSGLRKGSRPDKDLLFEGLVLDGSPTPCTQPGLVEPLAQSNGISDGQTAVAMCINALTGQRLRDKDINEKYGFGLLEALKAECKSCGFTWKDGGNIGPSCWALLEQKLNLEGLPVVVALNGPEFSPSGRGQIVVLTSLLGEKVVLCDPATGTRRATTRTALEKAPPHPDGNFIFHAERLQK